MELMMARSAEDKDFLAASCHHLLPERFALRNIFHLSYVMDLERSYGGFTIFTLLFVQPFDNLRTAERPYVDIGCHIQLWIVVAWGLEILEAKDFDGARLLL